MWPRAILTETDFGKHWQAICREIGTSGLFEGVLWSHFQQDLIQEKTDKKGKQKSVEKE